MLLHCRLSQQRSGGLGRSCLDDLALWRVMLYTRPTLAHGPLLLLAAQEFLLEVHTSPGSVDLPAIALILAGQLSGAGGASVPPAEVVVQLTALRWGRAQSTQLVAF